MKRVVRRLVVALGVWLLGMPAAAALAAVDFEAYAPGTVLNSEYSTQGVVFGAPPGNSGDGLHPVVRMPAAGQAQSGSQVADISTCTGCEFYQSRSTARLTTQRARVAMAVGYLGQPGTCTAADPSALTCAVVTLRAFDVNGAVVGQASVTVARGAGVRTPLVVTSPAADILGFELSSRKGTDDGKTIAIDDLDFQVPVPTPTPGTSATPTASPAPDFSLNPATGDMILAQGDVATDAITIARVNGSTGTVAMAADGAGVHASFDPNPAPGDATVLTVAADPTAAVGDHTITITGTPQSRATGPAARSFTLLVHVQPTCRQVGTAAELQAALQAGYTCVYVKNDADIDLSELADDNDHNRDAIVDVPPGVTIMSGRSPTVDGGILRLSHRPGAQSAMLYLRANTHVSGLRLLGYQDSNAALGDGTRGLAVEGAGVVIDHNELTGWPAAGIAVEDVPNDAATASSVRITQNYIHGNVQCPLGYGVVFSNRGFALIDHNLFDRNRHDVAGHGDAGTGYVARRNLSLTKGPTCDGHYNQHYDMHGLGDGGIGGIAGTFIKITQNAIRGAQSFGVHSHRGTFWLRGTPTDKAIFTDNVMDYNGDSGVTVKGANEFFLRKNGKLVIRDNTGCFDTAGIVAAGDFDGNETQDVFQAVGTTWMWSPSGRREWQFLRDSGRYGPGLAVGDFDGDGKADVFAKDGDRWLLSSGGTDALATLPVTSSIPRRAYRFGDFDGDGKTDVFRANGSHFFISSGAATMWQQRATSSYEIDALRFGDFDGDGTTDVFSFANGQWSVSDGGDSRWRRLNAKISDDLTDLAFADFNGDGRTDVARSEGGTWQVSWGGTSAWQIITRSSQRLDAGVLFGDFDGDGKDDVLRHAKGDALAGCAYPPGSLDRYTLASGGGIARIWSAQNML